MAAITLDHFTGVGPDREVFAIADVHGRDDLLEAVLDHLANLPRTPGLERVVVVLGDLIDRGPDSLGVLAIAMGAEARLDCEVVFLMGNHEAMLAAAVCAQLTDAERRNAMDIWLANGGDGVVAEITAAGLGRPDSPEALAHALGMARLNFLYATKGHYRPEGGDVLFVHAGLSPHEDAATFLARDWRDIGRDGFREEQSWSWIRGPFLDHVPSRKGARGHHGLFVVHGHTPDECHRMSPARMVERDRLNLDDNAVRSGRLRFSRHVGREVEVFEAVGYKPHGGKRLRFGFGKDKPIVVRPVA